MSAASEPLIWSPAEQLPRTELRSLQLERLRAIFGIEIDSLEKVAELPFTDKSPLREAYPFGLLRVPVASSPVSTRPAVPTASRPWLATRPPTSKPGRS